MNATASASGKSVDGVGTVSAAPVHCLGVHARVPHIVAMSADGWASISVRAAYHRNRRWARLGRRHRMTKADVEIEPDEVVRDSQHDGVSAVEQVRHLIDVVSGVDADDVGTARHCSELPDEAVRPVRKPDRNAVTVLDALVGQVRAECPDPSPQPRPGHEARIRRSGIDRDGRRGIELHPAPEHRQKRHRRRAFV